MKVAMALPRARRKTGRLIHYRVSPLSTPLVYSSARVSFVGSGGDLVLDGVRDTDHSTQAHRFVLSLNHTTA
jgi:hypothetical protein